MNIKLISTDFDGTLHADDEIPPVPVSLQRLIGELQQRGVIWVINTGRDLSSLLEGIARARLSIRPDYVVVVEREIYGHQEAQYVGLAEWNQNCQRTHAELFATIQEDLPELFQWVNSRFAAMVYQDAYSPFCLAAQDNGDADQIEEYLSAYARSVSGLTVVRNDVYARFCHEAFNKGTALAEISRRAGVDCQHVLAAGDHLNDLPMLSADHARWLIAPSNAVPAVKAAVLRQQGFVSDQRCGNGVVQGLEHFLGRRPPDQLFARTTLP